MTDHFDFSHALALLKQGKRVARKGWEEWGEMECVEMKPRPGSQRHWLWAKGIKGEYWWDVAQADVLAEDWHEVTG